MISVMKQMGFFTEDTCGKQGAGVGFDLGNGQSQKLTPKPKLAPTEVKTTPPEQDQP